MIIWISFLVAFLSYYIIKSQYRKHWDKNLEIDIFLPEENLHEGDVSFVKEVIVNDKMLPLPTLETRFHLDRGLRYVDDSANSAVSDMLYRRDVFALGIKRKISRSFEITCIKRGYYTLEEVDIISSDLFLSQKFLSKKKFFQAFYVYPKKVRSDKLALPFKQIMGELAVKKVLYEDPFSFAGIRAYTPDDTMNKINWKASAKSQDLVVNVFDSAINQKVFLILDTYNNDNPLYESLNEEAIRIVSALIERLLVSGVEVTLLGNSVDKLSGQTLSLKDLKGLGMSIIKQYLSRIELGKEQPIDNILDEIDDDSYVVLVSKNINHQEKIKESDFLWIVPYKEIDRPNISAIPNKIIMWEAEKFNVNY